MLRAQFAQFGEKDIDAMLSGAPPTVETERRGEAYRAWISEMYGPIFDDDTSSGPRIPAQAAHEFMAALRAGRVPEWAVSLAPIPEIKAAAKGGET